MFANKFDKSWNAKKWNELFESEEELLFYTRQIDIEKFKMYNQGIHYLEVFVKILNLNQLLSPKQMTQLKRLAQEIYKYHVNSNMGIYR